MKSPQRIHNSEVTTAKSTGAKPKRIVKPLPTKPWPPTAKSQHCPLPQNTTNNEQRKRCLKKSKSSQKGHGEWEPSESRVVKGGSTSASLVIVSTWPWPEISGSRTREHSRCSCSVSKRRQHFSFSGDRWHLAVARDLGISDAGALSLLLFGF